MHGFYLIALDRLRNMTPASRRRVHDAVPMTDTDNATHLTTALDQVRIVLVGTTHPGNIGATARAMKAMGLSDLRLVQPARFPAAEATARAAGADDLLSRARVHETLAEALDGSALVVGTTARERHIEWPSLRPRDAAVELLGTGQPAALVFGRERSGLTNDELALCQRAVHIPTDENFRSLNLAQAVQVCAYELRLSAIGAGKSVERRSSDPMATATELEQLNDHCLRVMAASGYLNPEHPKLLERRLRRFLGRAQLRHSESQIVRGFLSAIEGRLKEPAD